MSFNKKTKIISAILIAMMIVAESSSLNILGLFPHPGASHFRSVHPILIRLAEAGHNITVVGHYPDPNPLSNYKDLVIDGDKPMLNSLDLGRFAERSFFRHYIEFFMIYGWARQSCEAALNSKALNEVLNMKQKFDVIIVQQFNTDCMMGVAWKLKAPVIGFSSTHIMPYHYERLGTPSSPSYVTTMFLGYSEKRMTFPERISNWIVSNTFPLLRRIFMDNQDNALLRRKFGEDIPSVTDIAKNISLMFVNTHYSINGPKPLSPAVVEIGGAHIKEAKPIEKTLKQILDSAEHGVIYVNWGSMLRAESLPIDRREILVEAFGSFKETVIWKWESDTLPNQPANVQIRKWLPQRDILCHPNVRVFLSHGGLLSISEAAYCGVPIVATPIFGDQFYNVAMLVDRGMGTSLDFEQLTKEKVVDAIKFALEPQVRENAQKVSYSFKNRPQSPLDTALWWVEHVAASGGAQLTKSHSAYMNWYEYNSFDVLSFLVSTLIGFVAIWIWIVKRICCNSKRSVKVKSH